jgi:hypothetical protein
MFATAYPASLCAHAQNSRVEQGTITNTNALIIISRQLLTLTKSPVMRAIHHSKLGHSAGFNPLTDSFQHQGVYQDGGGGD